MKKVTSFLLVATIMLVGTLLFAGSIWKDDFEKIENWYDNKTDASFNAVIVPGKKTGTADVIQKGKETWGKVAFVFTNVDVDVFNILKVKVNKVDKNGDYKILVTTHAWDKSYIVIDRGKGKGLYEANIQEATGWKGKKSFNLVVVVEGKDKKITLDWIDLLSKETEGNSEEEE